MVTKGKRSKPCKTRKLEKKRTNKQNDNKLDVRAFLSGKTKERFLEVKEGTGIENNTEALRYLINEHHDLKEEVVVLRDSLKRNVPSATG